MIVKRITFGGRPFVHACDGNCGKAWGINNRPHQQLSKDSNDKAWLADSEIGEAPVDPGTYEGGQAKPIGATGPEHVNKWCIRECERSEMFRPDQPIKLRDLTKRMYNLPWLHP